MQYISVELKTARERLLNVIDPPLVPAGPRDAEGRDMSGDLVSLRMLLVDATTPVLGAASTLFFTMPERFLILILPFFAGGFLYLGAGDLLPEAHEHNPPVRALAASLAGFLLIFVVTRFLNV